MAPAPPMSVLAEPRRMEILRLVWAGERTAGDIAGAMPVTFGAVSQHLRVLLESGLVRVRQDGRRRWYTADRAALGAFAPALEAMWGFKLGELKRLAEAEQAREDVAVLRAGRSANAKARAATRVSEPSEPSTKRSSKSSPSHHSAARSSERPSRRGHP